MATCDLQLDKSYLIIIFFLMICLRSRNRVLDAVDGAAVGQGSVVVAPCTRQKALTHVCNIPSENDVDVSLPVADGAVTEAFREGYTGRFVQTLGTAIYRSVTG